MQGVPRVAVHAFFDGRDTPPKSAEPSLLALQALCAKLGNAHIASVSGRYYAMDRDKRWDRVADANRLLAYHRYVQRDQARRIDALSTDLAALEQVEQEIVARRAQLARTPVRWNACSPTCAPPPRVPKPNAGPPRAAPPPKPPPQRSARTPRVPAGPRATARLRDPSLHRRRP